jgi:hypothetical protein
MGGLRAISATGDMILSLPGSEPGFSGASARSLVPMLKERQRMGEAGRKK